MVIVGSGMKEYWAKTRVAVTEVSEKRRVATARIRMAWADVEGRLDEWDEVLREREAERRGVGV